MVREKLESGELPPEVGLETAPADGVLESEAHARRSVGGGEKVNWPSVIIGWIVVIALVYVIVFL